MDPDGSYDVQTSSSNISSPVCLHFPPLKKLQFSQHPGRYLPHVPSGSVGLVSATQIHISP